MDQTPRGYISKRRWTRNILAKNFNFEQRVFSLDSNCENFGVTLKLKHFQNYFATLST